MDYFKWHEYLNLHFTWLHVLFLFLLAYENLESGCGMLITK